MNFVAYEYSEKFLKIYFFLVPDCAINIRHTWIRIRVAQLTEQVNKYQIADIDVEERHQKNIKRTSKKHQKILKKLQNKLNMTLK